MTDEQDDVQAAKRVVDAIDEIGAKRLADVLTGAVSDAMESEQEGQRE